MESLIRRTRKANRMTLQQASDLSGVSIGAISQIERGIRKPKMETLQKLATCYGVNWLELVDGRNDAS